VGVSVLHELVCAFARVPCSMSFIPHVSCTADVRYVYSSRQVSKTQSESARTHADADADTDADADADADAQRTRARARAHARARARTRTRTHARTHNGELTREYSRRGAAKMGAGAAFSLHNR
jgi:hypothetical protein